METITNHKINLKDQIKRIATQAVENVKRYTEKVGTNDSRETLFLPMRHFNSDTPITPGLIQSVPYNIAEKPLNINYGGIISLKPLLAGGGYFLWHNGEGIAIDPGYGFVDSLHCYHGITASQINTVIITHDHMDHHADLETIFNLNRGGGKLTVFTNQEVIDAYGLTERKRVRGSNLEIRPIVDKIGTNQKIQLTENVKGIFLPAIHWQRVRNCCNNDPLQLLDTHLNAFGIQLIVEEPKETRILITGDTLFPIKENENAYFAYSNNDTDRIPFFNLKRAIQLGYWKQDAEENDNKDKILEIIQKQCKKIMHAYASLESSDIVCLHIGSIKKEMIDNINDFDIDNIENAINNQKFCYKGFHLGLTGMLRLMNLLIKGNKFDHEKGLVVITEFGEELLGNRQNICSLFSELMSQLPDLKNKKITPADLAVVPSEVTLKIKLAEDNYPKRGIICSYCQMLHNWKEVSGIEGPGEIISYAATGKNNFHTNCANWV